MWQAVENVARGAVRGLVRLYYAPVEVTDRARVPRTGPVLLAANHANSLLDPVLVGLASRRCVRFLAKAPLFDLPVLGPVLRAFGMLPAWRAQDDASQLRRNLESINAGAGLLARGEALGIFPEGRSHDAMHLEQVKSGVARMAVRAVLAGATEVTVVPVGLNFERKEGFRTGVWIRVGAPLAVAEVLAANGGEEKRASRALTQELDRRLREVVIHLDDPALEPLVYDLEVMLPPARRGNAIARLRHRKRIADAMNHFRASEPERAAAMTTGLNQYRAELAANGLEPRSPILRYRRWRLVGVMAWRALGFVLGGVPALLGGLHHALPWWLNRRVAARWQQGRSTLALTRMAVGLPLFALWYALVGWAMSRYFLPWVAWTWVAVMPFCGLLALHFQRRLREGLRGWWRQGGLFFRAARLRHLRAREAEVRTRLEAFAADYARLRPAEPLPEPFSWRRTGRAAWRWALILLVVAGIWTLASWRSRLQEDAGRQPHGLRLTAMSPATLGVLLDGDEAALRAVLLELDRLEAQAQQLQAGFAAGQRSWYRQADNDAARQLLLGYLNCRTALLRLAWKYEAHAGAPNETLRWRAFLVQLTAAAALYEASLELVAWFDREPLAKRKLNEPEPLWNIPEGLYDALRRNLVNPDHRRLLAEATALHRAAAPRYAALGLDQPPREVFHQRIERATRTAERLRGTLIAAGVKAPLVEARKNAEATAYRAQSFISSWVGDTKVRAPREGRPLIAPAQLGELRAKLQPGDILLERRNWYLSNAFLPGFWPHAALYVGTVRDLERLGLKDDPRVRPHWEQFVRRDENGHELVIIESVSEGVILNSFEHSVGGADAAAFLRPRLPEARIREAIARAFSHIGKPYDFEFDFFSTDKLVCTELVFRAYDGDIQFPLVDVMGRRTLPAIEMIRKYANERGTPGAQFGFVAFLDGDERRGTAAFADEAALVATLKRPSLEWLQGLERK